MSDIALARIIETMHRVVLEPLFSPMIYLFSHWSILIFIFQCFMVIIAVHPCSSNSVFIQNQFINSINRHNDNLLSFLVIFPTDKFNQIWPPESGMVVTQIGLLSASGIAWRHQSISWTNIFWLIIKGVLWHSPEWNFTRSVRQLNLWHVLKITLLKLLPHLTRPMR